MTENPGKGGAAGGPPGCAEIRDLLPLRAAGALGALDGGLVEAHLSVCTDCTEEARFVDRLVVARPEPPSHLRDRVAARLAAGEEGHEPALVGVVPEPRAPGPRRAAWGWGLAAAASVVVALGVGVLWQGGDAPNREALLAAMLETDEEWASEEWIVAGAPVWDALSDDVLLGLLIEEDI